VQLNPEKWAQPEELDPIVIPAIVAKLIHHLTKTFRPAELKHAVGLASIELRGGWKRAHSAPGFSRSLGVASWERA